MTRRLTHLGRDRRGNAITEFAIIAPVMMVVLMGLGDLLYQSYVQSLLDGAIQKAARDSAIQGGAAQTATLDAKVVAMMAPIVHNIANSCGSYAGTPIWCSTRKNYDTFQSIKPEDFTDSNGNGVRDKGECFTDINGNGSWDADPGINGQGGANDVTLYTMTITYPRIFPVAGLIGMSPMQTVTSKTLLKNQPYATQSLSTAATVCT